MQLSKNFNDNSLIDIPLDVKQLLLKGAKLKNTDYIYGIVLYTGKETKIMLNIIKGKVKFAYLDKLVDTIIFIIIIIRFIYVILFTFLGIYYRNKYLPNYDRNKIEYDYLFYYRHFNGKRKQNNSFENFKFFTSYIILSQTFLPTSISLLLAITKIIQSLFIEYLDKSLRLKSDQKMKCYSYELLGELGSVKYIFSDKTGTLTKNQTQFKACSIFTSLFDESYENSKSETFNYKSKSFSQSQSNFSLKFNVDNLLNRLKLRNVPLDLTNLENCPFKSISEAIEEFLLNMALNHDIVIDNFTNNKKINGIEDIKYQGTNPDEITLVGAAKELGFCFLGKFGDILRIKRIIFSSEGKKEKFEIKKYKILLKIPFNSERQRSTIIVRDLGTNKIKIFIKGSDTKIFEKLNYYSEENILEITKEHVDSFARRGLRTLCYCFRIIPENEYNMWFKKYNKAKENIDRGILINNLIEEIEKDCYLLGVTALEDQMQDSVK
jgi:magnesium-transporting ATPase (P-type)